MNEPINVNNINYIELVLKIQNDQKEMMQVLLDVKNEILGIRNELTNLSTSNFRTGSVRFSVASPVDNIDDVDSESSSDEGEVGIEEIVSFECFIVQIILIDECDSKQKFLAAVMVHMNLN